ncbi:MAG: histidine kinase [Myxococcota bacterium]
MELLLDTWKQLLAPRRLLPVLVLATPLLVAQHELSTARGAIFLAVGVVLAFLALGPFAYRRLFSRDSRGPLALRLLLMLALCSLAPLASRWVPQYFGFGHSFISSGANVFVSGALFLVGSVGLGRDIELEAAWRREHARAEAMRREAEHAQVLAMRAQFDPHFLFNTLNAIAEWCREDPAVAERAILGLSEMLREILAGVENDRWPLSRELSLVEALWSLYGARDPGRFEHSIEAAPADTAIFVPPLILLPLAENAMKHGPERGQRGPVSLRVEREGEGVRVSIENPGAFAGRRPGGEGVRMVERRLELSYGKRSALALGAAAGDRTRASAMLFDLGAPPEDA